MRLKSTLILLSLVLLLIRSGEAQNPNLEWEYVGSDGGGKLYYNSSEMNIKSVTVFDQNGAERIVIAMWTKMTFSKPRTALKVVSEISEVFIDCSARESAIGYTIQQNKRQNVVNTYPAPNFLSFKRGKPKSLANKFVASACGPQ